MTATTLPSDIVRRAQAADPDALGLIYERFSPGIFRYVYYKVGDIDLARDIQSDVFLRMLESIGRYEDRGWSISSWLYRIAHARTIDVLRRRERQAQPLDEWNTLVAGPDEEVESSAERGAVRRAMALLSDSQRQVLLLRHIYGLSLEETATQMGRTLGSVKALQHRAHERLAHLVRQELGDEE